MNVKHLLLVLFVILGAVAFYTVYSATTCVQARAEEGQVEPLDEHDLSLIKAMKTLQPHEYVLDDERAIRLARTFAEAAEEYQFDPKLLISVSFRESSFSREYEELKGFGSAGEIGLMQCFGAALRFRPDTCEPTLEGAWCQIQTGTRYLAHMRDTCPGSKNRWLAAYGKGKCISEEAAERDRGVRNAKRYYVKIGGVW